MRKSLKQRGSGLPVRFIYDETMPPELLSFLVTKLNLSQQSLIPGGRYHNFKDLMNFPQVGGAELHHEPLQQVPHQALDKSRIMFDAIKHRDFVLHHPYPEL